MSHENTEVYLVDGVRTPQGKYGGALASVRPDDLAALVVGEALRRSGAPAEAVEEVVLGAANQAGEDNRDVAQSLVVLRRLKVDEGITNADGGAIALGHPLGCSGARLLVTLLGRLEREGGRRGLATLCVGVGQGVAMVVETV